jgi:hypothetical protein
LANLFTLKVKIQYSTYNIEKKRIATTANYINRRNPMLKITLSSLLCCTLFTGASKAQTIVDYIPDTTPDERYTLHDDGTVTDTDTGLQWQRCSLGQDWDGSTCNGGASTLNWQRALQQTGSNRFAGYSDWRLPNVEELRSIVAHDRYSPAINSNIFPNTKSNYYWSSSPAAADSSDAWRVNFGYGNDDNYYRFTDNLLRLVRSGQ